MTKSVATVISCIFSILISGSQATSPFWPEPQTYSLGSASVTIDASFRFVPNISITTLDSAISRYLSLINVSPRAIGELKTCYVSVSTSSEENGPESLQLGTDDSYAISLLPDGSCEIKSKTVWGSLNAFETFTQLLVRDTNNEDIKTTFTPVSIEDSARFSHRGLMIDTSRHYLPVETILTVIETLPMSKFNVLHIHLVDAQSFPFDSPSAERISMGAYSPSLTYTVSDIKSITDFANQHGVRLVLEVDIPGHAASWTKGYPQLMAKCFQKYSYNINDFALNPAKSETYSTIKSILSDLATASGAKFLHIGGDEVVYGCWAEDESITAFMEANQMSSYDQLMSYFVAKADEIVNSLGATAIHWQEVFEKGSKVAPGTIFQVWKTPDIVQSIVKANYQVIFSSSSYWYLDHAENTWQTMYNVDPTANLTSIEATLVIGGEAVMFGEHVDEANLVGVVYPRAAAVGERLWSPESVSDEDDAHSRLLAQRCRMVQRGYGASPVEPGFCGTKYV